eukprot:GHVL01041375.1.p1 GENE.GHVL01041375.1~~GHVL01041375.1.p1  ORF type:complete len:224 (+),score=46.07 GHVL01041375.1:32-703(+)
MKQIWLDCDPGHDDAFAIILAAFSDKCELLGISTVHGNQSIEKTTKNAAKICSLSKINHVKVYRGQDRPLLRDVIFCPSIHGQSGLDGSNIVDEIVDENIYINNEKGVIIMSQIIIKNIKTTIVATGALTNIALMLQLYPEVKPCIDEIVWMGGAARVPGNITPCAEFNAYIDPEAASIVFKSGLNITMIPLDVTHTAIVTPAIIKQINEINCLAVDALGVYI